MTREVDGREVGEAPDRDGADVGRRKRVVVLVLKEAVVKDPVVGRRPARASGAQPAHGPEQSGEHAEPPARAAPAAARLGARSGRTQERDEDQHHRNEHEEDENV